MPVSLKYSSRAAATSITEVACPRPIPLVSRVMHIAPPPMPTFIKSAPHSAKKRKPSRSTIFPAPTFILSPYFSLIHVMVIFCHSLKPSEESMHRTSAPASTSAGTRSAKSRVFIPAPICSVFAGLGVRWGCSCAHRSLCGIRTKRSCRSCLQLEAR